MVSYIIAAPALARNDAVGNDILIEKKVLEQNFKGKVCLFAKHIDPELKHLCIDESEFLELISCIENTLIYHHCIYWPQVESYLRLAQCKTIIRYHSLTPPEFFENYDPSSYYGTSMGQAQIKKLVQQFQYLKFLSTSDYTSKELRSYGASRHKVEKLPPFFHLMEDSKQNESLYLKRQNDPRKKLLFVGRVVPNKGHIHLLKVLAKYIEWYGDDITLSIVGSLNPQFQKYYAKLEEIGSALNISSSVEFTGKVSDSDLKAYYETSDIFLCLSEHEGFCVPLLEAQAHRLPVIALDRGAVKGTLGKDQLVFENLDIEQIAVSIHRLLDDENLREFLIQNGIKNLSLYNYGAISQQFTQIIARRSASLTDLEF